MKVKEVTVRLFCYFATCICTVFMQCRMRFCRKKYVTIRDYCGRGRFEGTLTAFVWAEEKNEGIRTASP